MPYFGAIQIRSTLNTAAIRYLIAPPWLVLDAPQHHMSLKLVASLTWYYDRQRWLSLDPEFLRPERLETSISAASIRNKKPLIFQSTVLYSHGWG